MESLFVVAGLDPAIRPPFAGLPRRGAGIALARLRLDPDLVLGLLLEGFQRAGLVLVPGERRMFRTGNPKCPTTLTRY